MAAEIDIETSTFIVRGIFHKQFQGFIDCVLNRFDRFFLGQNYINIILGQASANPSIVKPLRKLSGIITGAFEGAVIGVVINANYQSVVVRDSKNPYKT